MNTLPNPGRNTIITVKSEISVSVVNFRFPATIVGGNSVTYSLRIAFTDQNFTITTSMILESNQAPTPTTICTTTDARLFRPQVDAVMIGPGPGYNLLAMKMGYRSFNLTYVRTAQGGIIVTIQGSDDLQPRNLISITKDLVITLADGSPAGTTFTYDENSKRLVLNLNRNNMRARYTFILGSTGNMVSLNGFLLEITECQEFRNCSPLFMARITNSGNEFLTVNNSSIDIARRMGYSSFNIALRKDGHEIISGDVESTKGTRLTVFTIQVTENDLLLFSVPPDNLSFVRVHREGDMVFLVLKSLPGFLQNYSATYMISLQSGQLVGGEFSADLCTPVLITRPSIPPIPPINHPQPGVEYPQVSITGFMTMDGQNVNQLDIVVMMSETRICRFTRCNPDFAFVMRGKGNSIVEKSMSLGVADPNQLITYAILRYVFSAILCRAPFNRFDVNFLRQRYTQQFLRLLAASQFSTATQLFSQFPGYENYFLS
jgi:hypothetical protein